MASFECLKAPQFSERALQRMHPSVRVYVKHADGLILWDKIYSLLYVYARGVDWLLVETVAPLMAKHFGATPVYRDVVGCSHQIFFRNLQEWVVSWFDATGTLRLRLADAPQGELVSFVNLKYSLSKAHKSDGDYGYDEELDSNIGGVIGVPALEMARRDGRLLHKRRLQMFALVLLHFPHDGIELKQIVGAFRQMYGERVDWRATFGQTANELLAQCFFDLLVVEKKSPLHSVVRVRLDAAGLRVDAAVLRRLGLNEQFEQQQRAFVGAPATPPRSPLSAVPTSPPPPLLLNLPQSLFWARAGFLDFLWADATVVAERPVQASSFPFTSTPMNGSASEE